MWRFSRIAEYQTDDLGVQTNTTSYGANGKVSAMTDSLGRTDHAGV
jgi:hypothetical protein